jgi:hypothetical protein
MSVTELRERRAVGLDELDLPAQPAIVVAVDGRPASGDALAWAADEALCRGMKLRVVTAYADPDHRYAPRSVEGAVDLQRRLRRQVEPSRPWVEEADQIIRRGSIRSLLAEALTPGDLLVVGEAADVSAMDPSLRPACPLVVVPVGEALDPSGEPAPRT